MSVRRKFRLGAFFACASPVRPLLSSYRRRKPPRVKKRKDTIPVTDTNENAVSGETQSEGASGRISIHGVALTVPAPYAPGPINLTPGEAAALNTALARAHDAVIRRLANSRISDDFPKVEIAVKVKELGPQGCEPYVVAAHAEILSGDPITLEVSKRAADPVEAEARNLARRAIRTKCSDTGITVEDFCTAGGFKDFAEAVAHYTPRFMEMARESLEKVRGVASLI